MGVVENDGCGVELLREAGGAPETQSLSLRPCRDPCESKVGDKVIVVVKSADIAMAAGEEHFNNLPFVAFERDILKELPRLVTRNGMPRLLDVARTICRDIQPDGSVNCVPQSKIGNLDAKLVEPRREVPRNKRPTRETEEENRSANPVFRQRFVVRLEPPPRVAKDGPAVGSGNLSAKARTQGSPRTGFKM